MPSTTSTDLYADAGAAPFVATRVARTPSIHSSKLPPCGCSKYASSMREATAVSSDQARAFFCASDAHAAEAVAAIFWDRPCSCRRPPCRSTTPSSARAPSGLPAGTSSMGGRWRRSRDRRPRSAPGARAAQRRSQVGGGVRVAEVEHAYVAGRAALVEAREGLVEAAEITCRIQRSRVAWRRRADAFAGAGRAITGASPAAHRSSAPPRRGRTGRRPGARERGGGRGARRIREFSHGRAGGASFFPSAP